MEGWICKLELLHGLKNLCMDKGLKRLGESYEDGHGLDELMNNLASLMKIDVDSASQNAKCKTPNLFWLRLRSVS